MNKGKGTFKSAPTSCYASRLSPRLHTSRILSTTIERPQHITGSGVGPIRYVLVGIGLMFTVGLWVNAHTPPSADEISVMIQEGVYDERVARMSRLGHEDIGAGLEQEALFRLRRVQLEALDLNPDDLVRELHDSRFMAFPYAQQPELQSTGTVRTLTVLMEFQDEDGGLTKDVISENIYRSGSNEAQLFHPYESVNSYYLRASQDALEPLNITGEVVGWYDFAEKRSEYEPKYPPHADDDMKAKLDNSAIFEMAKEALLNFDGDHDFSVYDNDHDGDIDLLTILYAGEPTGWGSFWWAYQWNFFMPEAYEQTFDGKRLNQFVFQFVSKRGQDEQDFNPTTLIHEMGHALGLPDYYDYDKKKGPPGGLGGLDMMDSNKGNHCAFSRILLDWVKPVVINSDPPIPRELIAASSTAKGNKAVAVFPGLEDSTAPNQELFLVENRHRLESGGNDSGKSEMPNDGILIWHVDATPNSIGDGFKYDNSYTPRKLIRLVRQDSVNDFKHGERATARTYFNVGEEFKPDTTPNSNSYDGQKTNVCVKEISPDGERMTVSIGFMPERSPAPEEIARLGPATEKEEKPLITSLKERVNKIVDSRLTLQGVDELNDTLSRADPQEIEEVWRENVNLVESASATEKNSLIMKMVVTEWAAKDGRRAAEALLSLGDSSFGRSILPTVIEAWAGNNPESAAQWFFDTKRESLESSDAVSARERLASRVFQWMALKDFDNALGLLESTESFPEMFGAVEGIREAGKKLGVKSDLLNVELEERADKRDRLRAVIESLEGDFREEAILKIEDKNLRNELESFLEKKI